MVIITHFSNRIRFLFLICWTLRNLALVGSGEIIRVFNIISDFFTQRYRFSENNKKIIKWVPRIFVGSRIRSIVMEWSKCMNWKFFQKSIMSIDLWYFVTIVMEWNKCMNWKICQKSIIGLWYVGRQKTWSHKSYSFNETPSSSVGICHFFLNWVK